MPPPPHPRGCCSRKGSTPQLGTAPGKVHSPADHADLPEDRTLPAGVGAKVRPRLVRDGPGLVPPRCLQSPVHKSRERRGLRHSQAGVEPCRVLRGGKRHLPGVRKLSSPLGLQNRIKGNLRLWGSQSRGKPSPQRSPGSRNRCPPRAPRAPCTLRPFHARVAGSTCLLASAWPRQPGERATALSKALTFPLGNVGPGREEATACAVAAFSPIEHGLSSGL